MSYKRFYCAGVEGGTGMIFIKTAWNALKKNLLMNLFTLLQMVAVLCITAVMVSSICIRYQYYTPFKDYFSSNGIFMKYNELANSQPTVKSILDMMNNEEFLSEFEDSESMIACHSAMMYETNESERIFSVISYDDEIINRFSPELQEGRWLNVTSNPTEVEVVVSENDYGWNVGDTIELSALNFPDSIPFNAKIVGKLKNNAKMVGGLWAYRGSVDFNDFYYPFDFEIEQVPILLFSYSSLKNLNTGLERESFYDVPQAIMYSAILTFSDDTSKEEIEQKQQQLSSYGNVVSFSLTEIKENSMHYLYEQMQNLFPIIVVLFILVAVSSISSSALSTRRRLKDYAVYYMNGLQWKHCTVINFIQSALISILSVLVAFGVLFNIQFTTFQDDLKIIWNPYLFASMGGLVVLYLIISMIMPMIIIGKNTPKQILTK